MRKIGTILFIFLGFVTIAFFIEAIYFYWILNIRQPETLQKSDCIFIFAQNKYRLQHGCSLAKNGYAARLSVTGWDANRFDKFKSHYDYSFEGEFIDGGYSRSTFEDILAIKRISGKRSFNSIILVTSLDHLPRVFLLSSIMLKDAPVSVQYYFVNQRDKNGNKQPLHDFVSNFKRREIVKLWISLLEMGVYLMSDFLISDIPGFPMIEKTLGRILL